MANWGMRTALVIGALAALAACGGLSPGAPASGPQPPREIRMGAAEMAIQRVEREVARAEVAEAVGGMIASARMCIDWPALWLEGDERRNVFLARFDLMARDWGEDIALASERRMQEFVDLGFLIARARPDIAPRAVTYVLTNEGAAHLDGSPYGGMRPSFCAPSGRRLAEIVAMEWGEFTCGSLRVSFTHVADDWPDWAHTQGARARVAESWSGVGVAMPGSVTLSRQWYRMNNLPPGRRKNGELRSLCYDNARERIVGDDLNLNSGAEANAEWAQPGEPAQPEDADTVAVN